MLIKYSLHRDISLVNCFTNNYYLFEVSQNDKNIDPCE